MDLARLAEGRLNESTRDRALAHLASCRACTAIYAELATSHLEMSSEGHGVDEAWLEVGSKAGPGDRVAVLPVAPRRPRWRLAVAVTTAAAATLAVGIWFLRPHPLEPAQLSADTLAHVSRVAREDSYGGLLYSAQLLPAPRTTRGSKSNDELFDEVSRQATSHPKDADMAF